VSLNNRLNVYYPGERELPGGAPVHEIPVSKLAPAPKAMDADELLRKQKRDEADAKKAADAAAAAAAAEAADAALWLRPDMQALLHLPKPDPLKLLSASTTPNGSPGGKLPASVERLSQMGDAFAFGVAEHSSSGFPSSALAGGPLFAGAFALGAPVSSSVRGSGSITIGGGSSSGGSSGGLFQFNGGAAYSAASADYAYSAPPSPDGFMARFGAFGDTAASDGDDSSAAAAADAAAADVVPDNPADVGMDADHFAQQHW
jgi:hypothetical protein